MEALENVKNMFEKKVPKEGAQEVTNLRSPPPLGSPGRSKGEDNRRGEKVPTRLVTPRGRRIVCLGPRTY